ncbi:MAG: restriction endonuclease subunit S [Bacillota bacterium]
MKRYEEYKESGIPLVGEVPTHWGEIKLKHLALDKNDSFVDGPFGSDLKTEHYTDYGVPIIQLNNLGDGEHVNKNTKYTSEEKAKSLKRSNIYPGDIVITKMMPVARAAIVNNDYERYLISSDCIKLLVDENRIEKRFLVYSVNSKYFRSCAESNSTGSTRLRTNLSLVKNFKVLIPPLDEQIAIANYLDQKTAQIDEIIEKKKELLDHLMEYRQSLITETVTCGLNPQAKKKNSNVEWIGQISEDWEVKKLKYLTICNGKTLNERTKAAFEFRYIDIGSLNEFGEIPKELEVYEFENAPSRARRLVRTGDTIISTVRTYLKAIGFIDKEHNDCIASTGFAVLTPLGLHDKFLFYAVRSEPFVAKVTANSTGVSYPAINASQLIELEIVYPVTIEEQKRIADFLDLKTNEIDNIRKKIQNQIKDIQKYRQSLIYETVTGKIDVQNYNVSEQEVKL